MFVEKSAYKSKENNNRESYKMSEKTRNSLKRNLRFTLGCKSYCQKLDINGVQELLSTKLQLSCLKYFLFR